MRAGEGPAFGFWRRMSPSCVAHVKSHAMYLLSLCFCKLSCENLSHSRDKSPDDVSEFKPQTYCPCGAPPPSVTPDQFGRCSENEGLEQDVVSKQSPDDVPGLSIQAGSLVLRCNSAGS